MLIAWGCYNLANVRKKVSSQQTGNNRKYLFMTVFIAGMSTLAIEFTTSRMLQTVYGTSNIVWANVIGHVWTSHSFSKSARILNDIPIGCFRAGFRSVYT